MHSGRYTMDMFFAELITAPYMITFCMSAKPRPAAAHTHAAGQGERCATGDATRYAHTEKVKSLIDLSASGRLTARRGSTLRAPTPSR